MFKRPYFVLYEGGLQTVVTEVPGGDYVWRAEATGAWGVTMTLQYLDFAGGWQTVKDNSNADVTLTANGMKSLGIAQNAALRVVSNGAYPANFKSVLAGL